MFKLNQNKVFVIVGTGLAIIALGVYFFIYGPLLKKLKNLHAECSAAETSVLEVRNIIESAGKNYGDRVLVTEEEAYSAVDELTKHGKSKGINFLSIHPKEIEKPKEGQYKILPIELEVESTYEQLAAFMGSLDDLEKGVIKVRSFDITPEEKNPNKFITNLGLDIYISGRE